MLYLLSAARLDLYSIISGCSLQGKLYQDTFPFFTHWPFLRSVVETSCIFEHSFTSETIEPDPCLRYLPVMITRLLLSLRKAANWQEDVWSFGEPTAHASVRFAERRRSGVSAGDGMRLDAFASAQEGTQSRV